MIWLFDPLRASGTSDWCSEEMGTGTSKAQSQSPFLPNVLRHFFVYFVYFVVSDFIPPRKTPIAYAKIGST